mgnify:CR=1 FL=1
MNHWNLSTQTGMNPGKNLPVLNVIITVIKILFRNKKLSQKRQLFLFKASNFAFTKLPPAAVAFGGGTQQQRAEALSGAEPR